MNMIKFKNQMMSQLSKNKIFICLTGLVISAFIVLLLCSCSAGATLSESIDATSAMATVKSVDGNKLQVSVMAMGSQDPSQGGMGQGSGGMQQGGGMGQAPGGMQQGGGMGQGSGDNNSTPPEKPDGDSSNSQGNPPEMPSGGSGGIDGSGNSQGTPPEKPSGDNTGQSGSNSGGFGGQSGSNGGQQGGQSGSSGGQTMMGSGNETECQLTINNESIIEKSDGSKGSLSDITADTKLNLTISNKTNVTKIQISDEIGGNNSSNVNNGTSANTFSSDTTESSKKYNSENSDENVVRAQDGANVELTNCDFEKSGDSTSSEDSDFYGLNAVVYAWNQAMLKLTGGKVNATSSGSNGVFCYGSGSTIDVSDTKIATSAGNSGGIEVSGGGTINATNLDVETQGQSSAAIRSDRGGGTENVDGGSYKTHGQGSPAIYCTANVNAKNAYMESETSEVNIIEGKNSINLDNCNLVCNTSGKYFRGDNIRNIMLYQSMSGDAEQGTCNYTAKNCKYNANYGNIFYITNTSAVINLASSVFEGTYEAFMKVSGNSENWGKSGSNGGTVTLNCENQTIKGGITVDSISKLDFSLTQNSKFEGSINSDGAAGEVNLTLDDGSSVTLTGDTYVSSLNGNTSGINLNGHKLFVNGQEWK